MVKQHLRTLSTIWLLSSLMLSMVIAPSSQAQASITIDHTDVLKSQQHAPIGENLNFLMSSDKKWPRKVSMQTRIKEMKLSILRFPYGHLGDNYLFTDAPFDDGINGLTPRVASIKEAPGMYYWAVDDNGYFKDALDFDEYMTYVQSLNDGQVIDKQSSLEQERKEQRRVEPLIMVNMLSYDSEQYPGTVVTFESLLTHAVEWVKYANITRDFKIKYWQLGNEVASHTDQATYLKNFVVMAKAMKAVDPSIQIGFGEDGRRNWLKAALADPKVSRYIDFISPHQYLHSKPWSESYQSWRDYAGTLTPKIDKFQRYADKSNNHKNVPIIVTEYGATGGYYPERDPKGLVFFKVLKGEGIAAGYLHVTNSGKQLTKVNLAAKSLKKNKAIDIELLDDAWIVLKASANNQYIKAPKKAFAPLIVEQKEIDASAFADGFKWRLLEVKKHLFYLESKLHPGFYVSYDSQLKRYSLGAQEVAKAEKFNLKNYQPNHHFPRNQLRMISSLSNNKILCMQPDNSFKVRLYRSTNPACQFSMQAAGKGFGKGAVSLRTVLPAGSSVTVSNKIAIDGIITRQINGAVLSVVNNEITENSIWQVKTNKNNFQLHVYGDKNNYLQVTKQGDLILGGDKSKKATRFTHTEIPNTHPKPRETPPDGNYNNDLWKSLVFAEMTLGALRHKNVTHMVHWNTHTSWHGKFGGHGNGANSLENSQENKLTPIGQVLKLINTHTLENILNVEDKHGFVRVYASIDPVDDSMSIILLNKNNQQQEITMDLGRYKPANKYQRLLYTGSNPEDEQPTIEQDDQSNEELMTLNGSSITTKLSPISLTVFRLVDPNTASAGQ